MRGYFGQKIALVADLGVGQTGLGTVGYMLVNGDGSTFQTRTTSGVSEVSAGTGIYKVELGTGVFSAAFDGYVLWDTGGGSPVYATEDVQMVSAPPAGTDYTAARAAKLDLLGAGSTSIASPVASNLNIIAYQGDDYKAADGRALAWTGTNWPTLTGATISFQLHRGPLTKAGSVLSATQAQVELTHTDLATLTIGTDTYALIATLSDTSVVTLATGTFLLEARP